jgi:hypothetical protein
LYRVVLIPRITDEKSAMEPVFATPVRASERWSRMTVLELDGHARVVEVEAHPIDTGVVGGECVDLPRNRLAGQGRWVVAGGEEVTISLRVPLVTCAPAGAETAASTAVSPEADIPKAVVVVVVDVITVDLLTRAGGHRSMEPYSEDVRRRVVKALQEGGMFKSSAARLFDDSPSWLSATRGSLA